MEQRVRSFHELHEALSRYHNSTVWVFRGQNNPDWKIVPKAGRAPYSYNDDAEMFETWKRRAIEYTTIEPKDDWDWLAIAQHHGLATRLLDWTGNPLVAAYFAACDESAAHDAVVYAYCSSRVIATEELRPLDFRGVAKFRPRGVASRIVRQDGLFTLHGPPELALDQTLEPGEQLEKIIIAASFRQGLIYDLFQYGISLISLFPDLDGLSAHINWYMRHSDHYGHRKAAP